MFATLALLLLSATTAIAEPFDVTACYGLTSDDYRGGDCEEDLSCFITCLMQKKGVILKNFTMYPEIEMYRLGDGKEDFLECMHDIPMSAEAAETCQFGCELFKCYSLVDLTD